MYELYQVGKNTYYIDCPAKMGLYRLTETDVCLIDSGGDKDAGRKVKKILDANGWRLSAIINTHSNADHTGGNRYLQQQTGCRIFAAPIEAAFARFPELEPAFLFGGYPCKELRHKFLMAQPSEVLELTDPAFPKELEVIELPGHFFQMIGIRTPDDVVFLADCLSSEATLDKYCVTFLYDVEAYLATLERAGTMKAACFVPAHAPVGESMAELAACNRKKVEEAAQLLRALCRDGLPFEEILRGVFNACGMQLDFQQYVLVGSTVRSYLSWLHDRGEMDVIFSDNRLLWKSRDGTAADGEK